VTPNSSWTTGLTTDYSLTCDYLGRKAAIIITTCMIVVGGILATAAHGTTFHGFSTYHQGFHCLILCPRSHNPLLLYFQPHAHPSFRFLSLKHHLHVHQLTTPPLFQCGCSPSPAASSVLAPAANTPPPQPQPPKQQTNTPCPGAAPSSSS